MVKEFSASPKPANKSAVIATVISAIVFVAFTITYSAINTYRGIVGLFALIALTAAIYLYTKYITVKYYYEVTQDGEDNALFLVRRAVGKKSTLMYMTALSNIKSAEVHKSSEKRTEKIAAAVHKFKPTLFPRRVCTLTVKSRLENSRVIIECTPEFAEMLLEYAKEEAVRKSLEEEEY